MSSSEQSLPAKSSSRKNPPSTDTSRVQKQKRIDPAAHTQEINDSNDHDESSSDIFIKKSEEKPTHKLEERMNAMHPTVVSRAYSHYFCDEVVERFNEVWPGSTGTLPTETVIALRNTPYISGLLQDELERLPKPLENSSVDGGSVAQLPEDQMQILNEFLNDLADPGLRKAIKESFLERHVEIQAMEQKRDAEIQTRNQRILCFDKLSLTERASTQVRTELLALVRLSHTESSMTQSILTSQAESDSMSSEINESWEGDNQSRLNIPVADYRALYSRILQEMKDIDDVLPDLCRLAAKNVPGTGLLQHVAAQFDEFLGASEFLKKTGQPCEEKIHKVLTCLSERISQSANKDKTTTALETSNHTQAKPTGNQPTASTCLSTQKQCNKPAAPNLNQQVAPGPLIREKNGSKPYLQTLLWKIGECVNHSASVSSPPMKIGECEDSSASLSSFPKKTGECVNSSASASSPPKTKIGKEAPIAGNPLPRNCFMNLMLAKEKTQGTVIFDENLAIPVELRCGCFDKSGPIDLLNCARDQCLAHIANLLYIGFHFGRYGLPCYGTAVVANMAAIQVLHLCYKGCGSPDAKLVLYSSKLLPLMSPYNYDHWAKAAKGKHGNQFKELRRQLFEWADDGMEDGVPKGFVALFNLMKLPTKKLYGLSVQSSHEELGDILGRGCSSVVFQRAQHNAVLKISCGFNEDIENELKILKSIALTAGIEGPSNHIPMVVSGAQSAIKDGKIALNFGSVLITLPGIETSPVGVPAIARFLEKEHTDKEKNLNVVLDGITSALDYLHERNFYHCDVSPKNIVIVEDNSGHGGEAARAVLIDYAFSYHDDHDTVKDIKGFRGTRGFTHRKVFQFALQSNTAWKPDKIYDKAALGFTLAFYSNGCVQPWDLDDYPKCMANQPQEDDMKQLNIVMDARLASAREVVGALGKALRSKIQNLLDCDVSI